VSFDLSTAKWVAWGAKRPYNTYGHIQEAFVRALRFMGKNAEWKDAGDHADEPNTIFLGLNTCFQGLPRRQDCWYVIHNGFDPPCRSYLDGLNMLAFGVHISTNSYYNCIEIQPEVYFGPMMQALSFRWGTDLLPPEIEANKPAVAFNSTSRVVNYVGTIDPSNRGAIDGFRRACNENGISFQPYGVTSGNVVSVEDNVRLIKESYMAPTIQRNDQLGIGYVACRLFKNISYGQFGITHSSYSNQLFGGKLVYDSDPYQLFYKAKERLQSMHVSELHSLMDEVAAKHTYVSKIKAIEHAIAFLEGTKI
jgi:hypothetical protein